MANEILVSPNPLRTATGVEGQLEIGGSAFFTGKPQGLDPSEFIFSNCSIVGTNDLVKNAAGVGIAFQNGHYPIRQPLWIGGFLNDVQLYMQTIFIGFTDNHGQHYWIIAYSNNADAVGWHYSVIFQEINVLGGSVGIDTPIRTGVAVYTDGQNIIFAKDLSGVWSVIFSAPIPAGIEWLQMSVGFFDNAAIGTKLIFLTRRLDEVTLPLTTEITNFEFTTPTTHFHSRVVDSGHFGITADAVGDIVGRVTVPDIPAIPAVLVQIHADALYLKPKDGACGDTVIHGTIVQFESNGGLGGAFEASGGTILSGLKWQAPYANGFVTFTYTIGLVTASCILEVQPPLSVAGVNEDGFYPDLAQGEIVRFQATCERAQWFSDPPGLVVRGGENAGRFVAPHDELDEFFGEKTVIITVRGCNQEYTFKVHIQAMYPTPKFCGAIPIKWLQDEPDFLPNRLVMTGGTSEVKNRNRKGINTWQITYDLLNEKAPVNCTCVEGDIAIHQPHCTNALATAERLSKFYRQVSMAKYFTVIDYHTETQFKYVRLTQFTRGHNLYFTEQARQVGMRYEGGLQFESPILPVPPHPVELPPDTTPPSVPLDLTGYSTGETSYHLSWSPSHDDDTIAPSIPSGLTGSSTGPDSYHLEWGESEDTGGS